MGYFIRPYINTVNNFVLLRYMVKGFFGLFEKPRIGKNVVGIFARIDSLSEWYFCMIVVRYLLQTINSF